MLAEEVWGLVPPVPGGFWTQGVAGAGWPEAMDMDQILNDGLLRGMRSICETVVYRQTAHGWGWEAAADRGALLLLSFAWEKQ